jgi:FkbM family methyltransferase
MRWKIYDEERFARLDRRVGMLQRNLEKLVQAQVEGAGLPIPLDYEPASIEVRAHSTIERKRAQAARKEPWTVAWIESLEAGSVLWDVGANIGAYSLVAALRPQGALRVVAIEPSAATYASLCENVVANRTTAQIMPLLALLGERTGLATVGLSDMSAGTAFHRGRDAAEGDRFDPVFEQPVLMFAVDDLVQRFSLPAPRYMKIDVDGAEAHVLRGARGTLADVTSALVEIDDEQRDEVDSLMADAGLFAGGEFRRDGEGDRVAHVAYRIYERS